MSSSNKTLTVSSNSAFSRPEYNASPTAGSTPSSPEKTSTDPGRENRSFSVESLVGKDDSGTNLPYTQLNHQDGVTRDSVTISTNSSKPATSPCCPTSPSFAYTVEGILSKSCNTSNHDSSQLHRHNHHQNHQHHRSNDLSPTSKTYTWSNSSFPWMQGAQLPSPSLSK